MSKKSICLAALALIFSFVQPVFANTGNTAQAKPCHCHDHKKALNQLNLTQEQKTKIKTIKIQAQKTIKENYKQLKAIKEQINALIANEKLDEAKLDNLISQRNKIAGAMLKNRIMMKNQIYNQLTNEQKSQYKKNM
ncbi:Spy/CpxP family protein refolding chaperone [Legionella sp. PATHC032]|uniref:Spy/CpxP family protein refolding chaperone n=1 Tax=Legionella sp. PATHC032 TaxID=2992039 RepID=UPI001B22B8C6|nr:Spy/CpxP family protein refolding chaperone [Legionella sp. PATHC032]MCW8421591.1 Spy/CpxP family protein refolding chaperone [Legionella sp. PATHC032]HAZ7571884.1 Spy/CpxP family protein refolding chaperone [Legionella pneumophila]HBA1633824.1 Spy/CpxP family protein refolding chaperone [Legionella pneumophila]